ncbi:MAG: Nucleotide-binding protein implicated in inhibition of septum formation, partial [Pseudomonadota bacterium]
GRSHTLYTGLTIIKKLEGQIINTRQKIVETKVKVKRLTAKEIERYIKSGEGLNKAGGYAIHGLFQSYIQFVSGSFSNVAGLPIHELYKALDSLGYYSSGESILHTKIA